MRPIVRRSDSYDFGSKAHRPLAAPGLRSGPVPPDQNLGLAEERVDPPDRQEVLSREEETVEMECVEIAEYSFYWRFASDRSCFLARSGCSCSGRQQKLADCLTSFQEAVSLGSLSQRQHPEDTQLQPASLDSVYHVVGSVHQLISG